MMRSHLLFALPLDVLCNLRPQFALDRFYLDLFHPSRLSLIRRTAPPPPIRTGLSIQSHQLSFGCKERHPQQWISE